MKPPIDISPAYTAREITDIADLEKNPKAWFELQPAVGKESWFLAYLEEGVIWGKIRDGRLALSSDVFPASAAFTLDAERLQTAYLFGENAEVRVWRDGSKLKAARYEDIPGHEDNRRDADCFLWGTWKEDERDGFTLLTDGIQGLIHAVPEVVNDALFDPNSLKRPVRLTIRRYILFDGVGQARFGAYRLVRLKVKEEDHASKT